MIVAICIGTAIGILAGLLVLGALGSLLRRVDQMEKLLSAHLNHHDSNAFSEQIEARLRRSGRGGW